MEILFLANRPSKNSQAATVTEYLDALSKYSKHNIFEVSMLHRFPEMIDLNRFDAVITHYSLSLGSLIYHYLGSDLIKRLKSFQGLKVAFLQDEYREIKTYWRNINELGLDLLFSCVPDSEISKVYPSNEVPNLKVVNVLTGYVPEKLVHRPVPKISERSIDVGYRTRKTPYWLGRLGYEKWWIAEEFEKRSKNQDLNINFSTEEGNRLYGEAWNEFIASCRAVIGVESGSSIIDFDGKLEQLVNDFIAQTPSATFEEVFEQLLEPFEGSLELNQISPRCFEAAALRTPMILFEGRYSGILKPGRHYISLKKDFSNFDEVIKKLRNHDELQVMADRTYREIALNPSWSFQSFVNVVDRFLDEEKVSRSKNTCFKPYDQKEFKRAIRLSWRYFWPRMFVMASQSLILGVPWSRKLLFKLWKILPTPCQKLVRPMARLISR